MVEHQLQLMPQMEAMVLLVLRLPLDCYLLHPQEVLRLADQQPVADPEGAQVFLRLDLDR